MSAISEREKLKVLLPHWVTHNKEHAEEYQKWADRASGWGDMDVVSRLKTAISEMKAVNDSLTGALSTISDPQRNSR